MPHDIPLELLEKALALTGKTMEDMKVSVYDSSLDDFIDRFSIEKFCYYLLSPEFIEKNPMCYSIGKKHFYISDIGCAIYEYQSGNPDPLISLLSKI